MINNAYLITETHAITDPIEYTVPNYNGYTPSNPKNGIDFEFNIDGSSSNYPNELQSHLKRNLFPSKESSNFMMNQNTNIQRFLICQDKVGLNQNVIKSSNKYEKNNKNKITALNKIKNPKFNMKQSISENLETVELKPKLATKSTHYSSNVARRYKSVNQRNVGTNNSHYIANQNLDAFSNDSDSHYPVQVKDYWRNGCQEMVDSEIISNMTPRK